MSDRSQLLLNLQEKIAACELGRPRETRPIVSTGLPPLDAVLPSHGLAIGSLVEILSDQPGGGAETLALLLARAMSSLRSRAVVIDFDRLFYPPAARAWGLPWEQLIVVRVPSEADGLWAADQCLRNRSVGAVWMRRERLKPTDFRRLHFAAEEGGTLGIVLRPAKVRGQPTWADVQLAVEPRPSKNRRLQIEVTRCRGGAPGRVVEMEWDDISGAMREPHPIFGPSLAG